MKLKLSPLWLFLLLLIVLIASSIFIKPYATLSKESFINFYGSTASNTMGLTIPNYVNKVNKLYDNDFFDPTSGNLLRVYASAYNTNTPQDTTGASIDHVDVVDRSGRTTKFPKGQQITTGALISIPNSYLSWTVYSTDGAFSTITSNQVLYCAWGQDTYIHIFDLNNNLNACGFLYSGSGGAPIYTNFNATLPQLGVASTASIPTDLAAYTFDSAVNQVVYKLTPNVVFIPGTGDLRVKDGSGKSMIYNRAGQTISTYSNVSAIEASTKPWIEVDLVGNFLIIYIPNQTKTTIVVLKKSTDGVSFSIVSATRFNADGSIQKDENTVIPLPSDLSTSGGSSSMPSSGSQTGSQTGDATGGLYGNIVTSFNRNFSPDEQASLMDNMMQSLKGALIPGAGGVAVAGPSASMGAGDVGYTNQQISDYILKTQIVPPICPAQTVVCPGCSSSSCASCGSPSAAGPVAAALAPAPASFAPAPARAGSPVAGTPSGFYQGLKEAGSETKGLITSTGSGTADLLRKTGSGAKHLLEETGSGTKQLLEETASGAVGLGKSAVGETVKLGKQAVGGTVDILKDVTGSAVGLVKSAGSEVKDILTGDQGSEYSKQQGIYGTQSGTGGVSGSTSAGYYSQGVQGPQNPWTYNGQLSEKPSSQFIPVTADFSKFSR